MRDSDQAIIGCDLGEARVALRALIEATPVPAATTVPTMNVILPPVCLPY